MSVSNELLLEHLKAIRAEIADLRLEVRENAEAYRNAQSHIVAIPGDERRLDLRETVSD